MTCPICGDKGGACHGSVPVRLTADQLADIGLKPDQLTPGGTIVMAPDQDEPKARYPKQEVSEGQVHGYVGNVEEYEPAHTVNGYSNSGTADAAEPKAKTKSAKSSTEPPIAGRTGTIGVDSEDA